MKKPHIFSLFLLLFIGLDVYGQNNIPITIHSRVDTSDVEVKKIVTLWSDYLRSNPDSVYDNPNWNSEEKKQYADFDLSRAFMYPVDANKILNYYTPTILSVEKEKEHYAIRTLFIAEGLQDDYKRSNPWCISKLYAAKENGNWKLKNALSIITKDWKRNAVGKITFVYPPHHQFNLQLAKQANQYCIALTQKFRFDNWQPFVFYVTDSPDEMGRLLNFDFYFTGYTTGLSMRENNLMFTGSGSEYYPHELTHMIFPSNKKHSLIDEGFATWQGGSQNKSFAQNAAALALAVSKNDTVNFNDVLSRSWGYTCNAYYSTGAILCKKAYETGGIEALQLLLKTPDDDNLLIQNLCQVFSIPENELDQFWRKEVLLYTPH
ncbi:MAG: hypothetical protein ACRC3B_08165 [Bacteroidia bacterium]